MTEHLMCDSLVEDYIDWLRTKITVAEVGDACEITTPFLDRHNDFLQIYVTRSGGDLLLTDDGYTIRDLAMSGCSMDTPRRKQILESVVNGFGVRKDENDALITEAKPETFPQKKHALLQAMLAVNDMFVMERSQVTSLFMEDVEQHLRLHSIRFSPRIQFSGKSGFAHHFDFLIPPSEKQPERIIRAINHPERGNIASFLFSWSDTKDTRPPKSSAIAFLNDMEKPLSSDLASALSKYDVQGVPWSQRDQHIKILAS